MEAKRNSKHIATKLVKVWWVNLQWYSIKNPIKFKAMTEPRRLPLIVNWSKSHQCWNVYDWNVNARKCYERKVNDQRENWHVDDVDKREASIKLMHSKVQNDLSACKLHDNCRLYKCNQEPSKAASIKTPLSIVWLQTYKSLWIINELTVEYSPWMPVGCGLIC